MNACHMKEALREAVNFGKRDDFADVSKINESSAEVRPPRVGMSVRITVETHSDNSMAYVIATLS
jgi:hypothetical protein